ncbi:spermine synthase [Oscillatoriales cyanobacterium USR001]|nr:spermine synthase [Oscillatoriales cyanobacterium USR001]
MISQQMKKWQDTNLKAIQQQLSWLVTQPDGVIFCEPSGVHFVVVRKTQSLIKLSLVEKIDLTTDLVQSVLNLNNPLDLVSPYTQAMLLSLVWKPQPQKIYIAGFGGGRIPLVLHHYFPETAIECADIEPTAITVAEKFFGIKLDNRLQLTIKDGREYLEQLNQNVKYDIIMTDVFFGNGYMPHRLATKEFYELCQKHLSTDGVVAMNILQRDEFYIEKVKTLQAVFKEIYLCPWNQINTIVFGTNSPRIDRNDFLEKTKFLQEYHQFSFPLIDRALEIKLEIELSEILPNLNNADILRDDLPPTGYFNCWLF